MKKGLYLLLGVVALGVLWFAYYALSPLFRTVMVDEAAPEPVVTAEVPSTPSKEPVASSVIGTTGHPASGVVRVVGADGKTYIRYENFNTINGPDLYVYLAKDLNAKEYVNLGTLRATEGNVNYEVPETVNIAEYRYVLTWCQQFGVLFNYAEI